MMVHCKTCKNKFYLKNEDSELEGQIIECKFCNEKWLYESKTRYLENRLTELNEDLNNTESKINLRKKDFQDKINQLENDLKNKNNELDKQKLLQGKVTEFENRLIKTEKLNNEELELHKKAGIIKKQIKSASDNISNYNKDIEEKTNYLESKINSYNKKDEQIENKPSNIAKKQIINNEVVDININKDLNNSELKNKDKIKKNLENKKYNFFSPKLFK